MARPLDAKDLPPEIRDAVKKAARGIQPGPNALIRAPRPETVAGQGSLFDPKEVAKARGASKRSKAGASSEREFAHDCQLYDRAGIASIHRHDPPRVLTPKGWRRMKTREDERRVDFSGIVHDRCYLEFDLKRCSRASYQHSEEQRHQLRRLLELRRRNRRLPVRAFLIVLDDEELQLAYLVEDPAALRRLLAGESVALRTLRRALGARKAGYEDYDHHFPHVRRTPGVLIPEDVITWDWIPTLLATHPPMET